LHTFYIHAKAQRTQIFFKNIQPFLTAELATSLTNHVYHKNHKKSQFRQFLSKAVLFLFYNLKLQRL